MDNLLKERPELREFIDALRPHAYAGPGKGEASTTVTMDAMGHEGRIERDIKDKDIIVFFAAGPNISGKSRLPTRRGHVDVPGQIVGLGQAKDFLNMTPDDPIYKSTMTFPVGGKKGDRVVVRYARMGFFPDGKVAYAGTPGSLGGGYRGREYGVTIGEKAKVDIPRLVTVSSSPHYDASAAAAWRQNQDSYGI